MSILRLAAAAAILVATLGVAGFADEPTARDVMSRLDALIQRVEALERRIQHVEQRLAKQSQLVPEKSIPVGTRVIVQRGSSVPLWKGDIHNGPWVEKVLKGRLQPTLEPR